MADDPDAGRTDAGLREGEATLPFPGRHNATLVFIGRIRTPWRERRDCPRRGALDGPDCRIELDPLWQDALDGVEPGAMLQVLYWMHLARRDLVRQRPHGSPRAIGTFALRSPMRPNPIASSSAVLRERAGLCLVVGGLDCLDGTPLLDIKPERCPMWP